MKKALYINIGGEGHLNPTLGLVQDLVQRGDNIVYYSSRTRYILSGLCFYN